MGLPMRRAARIDSNQNEIVEAFRKLGATVSITSAVGQGFPDLCVGAHGKTCLVEVKNEAQPPNKRKLTPDQVDFHANYQGKIAVVENELDCYQLMREMAL